jgi:hypothetical protein
MEKGLQSLNELLVGDRAFQIPPYQRQYSWDRHQLDDLWEDVYYLDPGKKHFFGTILLKDTEARKQSGIHSFRVSEIIDGQQRITTVLIFLREIIAKLKTLVGPELTIEEISKLESDYLKYKDIYKLTLLGDDAEFFESNIVDGVGSPQDLATPSRKRLLYARDYFRAKLQPQERNGSDSFKAFLLALKEKLGALEIIKYVVERDEDAVLIFETVNDRGKDLSKLDKTKSFLMHLSYLCMDEDNSPQPILKKINDNFGNIYHYVEDIQNAPRGEDFDEESVQRYHFVLHETSAKESVQNYMESLKEKLRDLYRSDKVKCLQYISEYSKDLEASFLALKEIVYYNKHDELGSWLGKLFTLKRITNFVPLLISQWIKNKNQSEKIVKALSLMESFSFRVYAIGHKRSDTAEGPLHELAHDYYKNQKSFSQTEEELKRLIVYYEDETNFDDDLKVENFYDKIPSRDIKFLMYEYEQFLRNKSKEPLEESIDNWLSEKFEIEHIWPDNESVSKSLVEEHEANKHRLGNLTVASKFWNSSWGNKPFKSKRSQYDKSSLRIQRELSKHEKWRQAEIMARQESICAFAKLRWPGFDDDFESVSFENLRPLQ